MVTQSPESNCLMIYDIDGFGAWVESLFARDGGYSASNAKHVARRRVLNSRARKVELDKTGRIGLSAELRNAVGIDKDVVVVGNDTSIEIWDEARWDEYCANVDILDVYDDES
jgi:MraZ protein